MDYRDIPLGLEFGPEDKRDWTMSMFGLADGEDPHGYPETYEFPFKTPVRHQGMTSMCLDYTYSDIESMQYGAKYGKYIEMALGYRYGQKLFPNSEGMAEVFEVSNYVKNGLPPAYLYNVVGTSQECKAYFEEHNNDEIKKQARLNANRGYVNVKTYDEIIRALITFVSPGYIGVDVYVNFYEAKEDGYVPFPEGRKLGAHAMVLFGVVMRNGKRAIKMKNTYGEEYGDGGYLYIDIENPCIRQMRMFVDALPQYEMIEVSIGDPVVRTLKGDITMDVAPFIASANDRSWVPLRFVSEALGFKVNWYANMGTKGAGLIRISRELYPEEPPLIEGLDDIADGQ